MKGIDSFILKFNDIRNEELGTSLNLYFGTNTESQIRKWNLTNYLNKMISIKPKILLLGEAPGYKGCKLTGIPFTSENIIANNEFFQDRNYKFINSQDRLQSEISATIVWNELMKFTETPLIWNIFPFHPYNSDKMDTNRTPNYLELELGKTILNDLLDLFSIQKIIALGRKPEEILKEMKINYEYVRHPANGGKKKFAMGLSKNLE